MKILSWIKNNVLAVGEGGKGKTSKSDGQPLAPTACYATASLQDDELSTDTVFTIGSLSFRPFGVGNGSSSIPVCPHCGR